MRIASLHRYPVKSMLGEPVGMSAVTECGLTGDRGLALIECETGLVASAKQPRKWGGLLQCEAAREADGSVTITLPGGRTVRSGDPAVDEALSAVAGRAVTLSASPPADPELERLWPDVAGLAPPEVVDRSRQTPMAAGAPGTFFDYAPIHIVTMASLRALERTRPDVDVAALRFRPNLVVEADGDEFVENDWAGRQLAVGEDVVLNVITVSPRCAVPGLAHGDRPADVGVLRAVVAANRLTVGDGRFACVGAYAAVIRGGEVRVGDEVALR